MDLNKFRETFFSSSTTADISVDSNANVSGQTCLNYKFESAKPFHRYDSYYILWKAIKDNFDLETANKIIEDQLIGRIYINDFSSVILPYCFNYSTYDIALEGLHNLVGDMYVHPPKSLSTFFRQVEQFATQAANSTMGATGFADLLIVSACYVDKIKETNYDGHIFIDEKQLQTYLYEVLVNLIYTLNTKFRGNQSPFTNLSIYDKVFLESLCPDYQVFGKPANIETVQWLQRIFVNVMNDELTRTPLTFPVTTACFAKDKEGNILDKDFLEYISEVNLKYGFINIYCGETSTLSSCCRLRSERKSEYFNTFGAGSTKIGSLGVVTLNLPRLAS